MRSPSSMTHRPSGFLRKQQGCSRTCSTARIMSPPRVSRAPANARADDLAGQRFICRPFRHRLRFGCRVGWVCGRSGSGCRGRPRSNGCLDCRSAWPETDCRWNHPLPPAIAITGSGGRYVPAFKPRTADKGCFRRPFHDGRVHDGALYRGASFRRLTIGFGRSPS